MLDARLFALLPTVRNAIVASVIARWLALLAQIVLFAWLGAWAGAALNGYAPLEALYAGVDASTLSGSLPYTNTDGDAGTLSALTASPFGFLLAGGLWIPGGCIVAIVLLQAAARWSAARAGSIAGSTLSQKIFSKVVELGPTRASIIGDGEVVSLMGDGVETMRPYFSKYAPQFFFALLAPLTLFFAVAAIDIPAAVVLLVCVPLMPASIMVLMRRAKKYLGDYWGTYVDLGGAFLDTVRGLTTLKVYGTDGLAHNRLDAQAKKFGDITMKLLTTQLQSVTFMDLFTYGGIALGCVVVALQVGAGTLSLGGAVTIVLLTRGFFLPMREFGSYFHTGMNATPVIDQICSLLDAPNPHVGTKEISGAQITIEARGLSFSYESALENMRPHQGDMGRNGEKAARTEQNQSALTENAEAEAKNSAPAPCQLSRLDLTIRPNSFIGITGPSGSGKSTLASILAGDLAGYTGSVRVNGIELRDATARSVHETVAYVSRSSHVFRGTFRGNLTIAAPNANDAALWDALRRARLADFVYESGGLDAPVEADGANLSGGQRQRLVFARALLLNAAVYVFDEATANIDAESERYLLAVIQKIALSKTVIVISHRLPLLRYADEVLVMRAGRVEERGTHAELMSAGGLYRSMWDRSAELEAFAASVMDELDDDEPDKVEEALASMPGMMAGVMRAFMGIAEAQRYQSVGATLRPDGHPAWIPLPDYKAGMSRQDVIDSRRSHQDASSCLSATSNKGLAKSDERDAFGDAQEGGNLPSFMNLADATADGADAEAIKAAMRQVRDHMQSAPQARVIVEPLPPAHRPALTIVRKCLALTSDMVPRLVLAVALGLLSWLLACGVLVFATAGVLAALGTGTAMVGPFVLSTLPCLVCACVCAALRGPAHYAERLLTHDCTFKTVATIRSRVFGRLRELTPAKVEGRDAGDLISLLTSDIELLEGFYSRALVPVASVLIVAIVCISATAVLNAPAACAMALICLVVGVAVPAASMHATRERHEELRAYGVLMTGFLLDSLRGMRDLLSFGRAQEYADELGEHLDSMALGESSHAVRTAFLSALPPALSLLGALATAWVCAQQVACAALSPAGAIILVVGYLALMDAVCSVAGLGTSLQQVLVAADRVLDVMEERPAVEEKEEPRALDVFGGIALEDVTFGYESDTVAVDDVTFTISPGTFTCITGESGVGKSTLLRLAQRFWDVRGGKVSISGVDMRDVCLSDLRNLMCYMTQDTYLFEGSLRDNLLVARPDATDEQIEEALAKAALLDTVKAWQKGLDTTIASGLSCGNPQETSDAKAGSKGVSDGERQRIGLARAFLKDAPLFLLDEPTSNLDALNEATILRSLCQYAEGKTVVIVSHRRAVAAIVDKVLVVER